MQLRRGFAFLDRLRRRAPVRLLYRAITGRAPRRSALIVEDQPALRKQLVARLTKLGFDAVAVADGDAALSQLRRRRPDLLCLDLRLPVMSGYEVCEQIRTDPELKDLAVLMMSERSSPEVRAHSYEAGADAYLDKPYTLDELAREVRRLLDGTERRRASTLK